MFLTIFTPTYNRAHTLTRLYNSLVEQRNINFEWIIIDDASDDNTQEVVQEFDTDKFSLRYYIQEHGGKHRAINRALDYAEGDYFFIVDSDDMLTPDATGLIEEWVRKLPSDEDICGVSGMRIDLNGNQIGSNGAEKGNYIDATNLERRKYNLLGDKAEVYKTDILRKYPFPEFEGEYFVTESIVWDAIAADGYKIRWYNVPLYLVEYLPDGLSKSGANAVTGASKNFNGYLYSVEQYFRLHTKQECYRKFAEFNKVCRSKGISFPNRRKLVHMTRGQFLKMVVNSSFYRMHKRLLGLGKDDWK